ncbi:hypothetical protein GCM10022261_07600 [Brevibacterium daeguense]|uniref:LysM domain-containing protein n=1 Tax=Brevibacterium daeguense TaxID=909936 RepID=A0ABP8EGZ2_9MICO|nr:LysM peptidoglycan-binding domain-containing protein [Brevibacterium daeguense]
MTYTPTTRLPHQGHQAPGSRKQDVLKGIGATIGAVLIVIVLPTLLVMLVGNPFAGFIGGSGSVLTAGLDAQLIINVFVIVLWAAWAYFTMSLLIEFVRYGRSRNRPGRGLAPGGAGILARRMVASIMLLAGASAITPSFQSLASDSAVETAAAAEYERSSHELETVRSNVAAAEARQEARAEGAAEDGSIITYVVKPPQHRHYDTLWDISERFLGDGMRYRELFELNKDKEQPDGTKLRDADLIYPGWTLRMPADAQGEGLHVFNPSAATPLFAGNAGPAGTASSSGVDSATEAGQGTGAESAQATGADAAVHAAEAQAHRQAAAGIETGLNEAMIDAAAGPGAGVRHAVGGGLLAAGLLLALSARRGPFGEVSDERMLRLAENTPLAFDLDRALRCLALGCRDTGVPLPEATMVMAGPENIILHHASGPELTPPWPWRRVENGTAWIVDHAEVPAEQLDVPAPFPALVNVASTVGFEILIDLESAPGLVSVAGDDERAREVLMSMAVELATNVWSDGVSVDMVGFGSDLSAIAPGRIRHVDSLDEILDEVAGEEEATQRLLEKMGMSGVLAGRAERGASLIRPRVVFTSGVPAPEETMRIQRMVGLSRVPLAVVNLGHSTASRWKLVAGGDGTVSLDVFNLHGTARRITVEQTAEIAHLFRTADQARQAAGEYVERLDPQSAAVAAAVLPLPQLDPATLRNDLTRRPEVIIRMLGPVTVEAPGPVDPHQRPLLTELVVAAALHPEGLHDAVLRSIVWPRGVTEDVVQSSIAAAQAWLGREEDGRERLRTREDGMWELSADVINEWALLSAVAHTGYGTLEEIELFGLTLDRATGEVMAVPEGSGFSWMAFHAARRDARVLITTMAEHAAAVSVREGRTPAAIWFLRQGITLVPTAETLWRELLRLTGGHDPAALDDVAASLFRTLKLHGVHQPEPETDALVAQLVPHRKSA